MNEPADTKPTTGKGSPRGGRPRKLVDVATVLASTEGQKAIAAAAAQVNAPVLKQIEELQAKLAALPLASGPGGQDLQAIFSQMALTMAAVSDQGQQRVRISPQEQTKRDAAKEKMGVLIMDAFEKYRDAEHRGDEAAMDYWMPYYEFIVATHIQDQLVQPFEDVDGVAVPTVRGWQGPPGPSMKPINEIATLIFEEYKTWIGGIPDTINGVAAQPQWVMVGKTNGLTVKTTRNARFREGAPRRQMGGLPDSGELRPTESGPAFAMRRRASNTEPQTRHVLGTIVPPAKDMVPGQARRA